MIKERRELFALFHEQSALSLTKNEQIARKNYEQILNPDYKLSIQMFKVSMGLEQFVYLFYFRSNVHNNVQICTKL